MDTSMNAWDVLARDVVPSSHWAAGAAHLGPSEVEPIPLGGSPIVDVPAAFLDKVDLNTISQRMPARGLPALRRAIAGHYGPRWGRAIDPDVEVVVTNGAMHALDCVVRALVPPGGTVGMLCPGFFLDRLVADRSATLVRFDTDPDHGWHPTAACFDALARHQLDLLVIVNPGNPTGAVLDLDELAALVAATDAAGTPILVDEAYEAFTYGDARHVALASLPAAASRTVTVHSFTKGFGLRAARVGSVIGPEPLIRRVAGVQEWTSLAVNPVSQWLAAAALKHAPVWQPELVATFDAARDALLAAVADGRLPTTTLVPEGGTFAALDVRDWPDGATAARRIWQATGIACPPWSAFPGDRVVTDGWLRLGLGGPSGAFTTAVDRLAGFFAACDPAGQTNQKGHQR